MKQGNAVSKSITDFSLACRKQLVRVYIFGTVQLTCQWLLGEFDNTADHLAELFEKAVPEPLKEYLNIK